MTVVYLLTQTETLIANGQDYRYDRHIVSAYTDPQTAYEDLAQFARDAFEFNRQVTEGNGVIVMFPGDSNVYTLLGRTYSLEECPLH